MLNRWSRRAIGLSFVVAALSFAQPERSLKAAQGSVLVQLTALGTSSLSGSAAGAAVPSAIDDFARTGERVVNRRIPATSNAAARVPADHVPAPSSLGFASSNPGLLGFDGLTHRDQRIAGTGAFANTQFNKEPPDQGLCVGNAFVVETVNTAVRVRTTTGALVTNAIPLNQFFGLTPEVIRSSPPVFGDFTSDPKCYYDARLQRFFLTLVQLDVNPSTGVFAGPSSVLIAVSQTSNPAGSWFLYKLNATNDGTGGTPSHPGCPCFGDQPLIGADANGFYVTTNEFSVFLPRFNGAQIYAMSKASLAAGILPPVALFEGPIPLAEGFAYSVQPATTPPGGTYEGAAGGTEYFMSPLEFTGGLDNRIAVWALTNTSSLNAPTPAPVLSHLIVDSEVYGLPNPAAEQKNGPTPLADALTAPGGPKPKLELVDSNDDRMNQVVLAAGRLYGALDTVVKTENGPARAGIAYFILTPAVSGPGALSASMFNQGYVSVNGEHVMYPSVAVNNAGAGAIAFSISSVARFPSAAYVPLDASGAVGPVHIAATGAFPEDGLSGYAAFGGLRVARWGDYSAATVDEGGNIWMAAEYIPNLPRTLLANWGTFISRLTP
jgi:hypothetical protein